MATPFSLPRFYPILDTTWLETTNAKPLHVAENLLDAGARILQYRHKAHWTQSQFDEAQRIAALCREAGALFVLNDRADYAHLIGAGLHLGQEDLPPVAARRVQGRMQSLDTPLTIGSSSHTQTRNPSSMCRSGRFFRQHQKRNQIRSSAFKG